MLKLGIFKSFFPHRYYIHITNLSSATCLKRMCQRIFHSVMPSTFFKKSSCKLASCSIDLDCLCHIFSFILFQMFLKGWDTCRMWFGIAILKYARLSRTETLGIWVVTYVSSKSVETVEHQCCCHG